jgi:hypothetical protein
LSDQSNKLSSKTKTLKTIQTNKFELGLFELPSGQYVVAYTTMLTEEPIFGEPMTDLNTASFMYDLKLAELEGH